MQQHPDRAYDTPAAVDSGVSMRYDDLIQLVATSGPGFCVYHCTVGEHRQMKFEIQKRMDPKRLVSNFIFIFDDIDILVFQLYCTRRINQKNLKTLGTCLNRYENHTL